MNLIKMKNKDYYYLLINKEHTEIKSNTKWARGLQIDETSLKPFFSRTKNVCKDNKLREFYFKLLQRIVVTKRELFLFGMEDNSKCRYCKMNDSIIHTFHNCNWSQSFFSEVIKWFNKENSIPFSLSPIESIFGKKLDNKSNVSNIIRKLNSTFFYANYYLYNQKLLHGELSVKEFAENLKFKYAFETFHV